MTGQPDDADAPVPGARLLELVQVMDTLRRNCPWDAGQTQESLAPYLLEETYEAVDALAAGDQAAVREELGDVLLQVVFHARVAAERTDGTGYDIDDVADGIIAKLTRRHPHVFGDVTVSGADEVTRNWDAIKAAERAAKQARSADGTAGEPGERGKPGDAGFRPSALDGVPLGQPALSLAAQLLRRAEKAGAPAELAQDPADPVRPISPDGGGTGESDDGPGGGQAGRLAAGEAGGPGQLAAGEAGGSGQPAAGDVGRELLALVNRARAAGIDPELELRAAALAYAQRVRDWEAGAR